MIEDINSIRKDVQEYLDIKVDLIRLHTAESISRMMSSVITSVIVGYLLFFILVFLSFAAGFYFGSVFNSNELGFLLVAGFYMILLLSFLLFRKKIVERPVIKSIMKLFFPKFGDDEKYQRP
jgi:hypothetical protein